MPRPPLKRRKPNHTNARGRSESPKDAQLRQQLERRLANKPVGQRPADSDDSDRLVTRTPSVRGANSTLRKEIYASGAVAKGDKPGAYPTRAERRRNLQNDTARVIRQSRSRSQSTQDGKSTSSSPAPDKVLVKQHSFSPQNNAMGKAASQPEAPRTAARIVNSEGSFKTGFTPLGETSILGTLKPRKRQASILHLIDNEDSSILDPEDEERFLPDDESTPLNNNRSKTQQTPQQQPQPLSSSSSSRKRKLGAEEPEPNTVPKTKTSRTGLGKPAAVRMTHASITSVSSTTSPFPGSPQGRSQSFTVDKDDIMALPQSSSPEATPEKQMPDLIRTQQPVPVSTKQLQSLMPSKRRRGARERTKVDNFDILEDTSDSNGNTDDSVFLPKKRASRAQRTNKSSKAHKGSAAAKAASKKSTISETSRLVSVSLQTPMPLTRSIHAENRKLRTPSQHSLSIASTDPDCKPNGGPKSRATKSTKQSGGYPSGDLGRSRSQLAPGKLGADLDQENTRSISKQRNNSMDKDIVITYPLTLAEANELDLEAEIEREYPGTTNDLDEASKWKTKWADIDEWSLDFEEVNVSTQSDSPLRR